MPTLNQYWISEPHGIPKENRNIFNEYLLSLKRENKEEATVSKLLVLFLLLTGYRLTELLDLQVQDMSMEMDVEREVNVNG